MTLCVGLFRNKMERFPKERNKNPWQILKRDEAFELAMPGYKERPDVWINPTDSIVFLDLSSFLPFEILVNPRSRAVAALDPSYGETQNGHHPPHAVLP